MAKTTKQPVKEAAAEAFTIEDVKKLVALVEKTDVSLVAWSRGVEKVVIRRGAVVAMTAAAPVAMHHAPVAAPLSAAPAVGAGRPQGGGQGGRGPGHAGQLAVRRHLLPRPLARLAALHRRRPEGEEGPGPVHRRGHEADERDRVRGRRDRRRDLRAERHAGGVQREALPHHPGLGHEATHVQEGPHRQPGRDRPAGDPRLQGAGHRHGGGPLHGRRRVAPRPLRRRGHLHRAAAVEGQLPQRPRPALRGRRHRRRRHPPRLRLPLGAGRLRRDGGQAGDEVHRPAPRDAPAHGQQDRGARGGRAGRPAAAARRARRAQEPRGGRGAGRADRLPGHPQGGRRRRRPRHEDRPRLGRHPQRLRGGLDRGAGGLRRRLHVPGALRRGAAPHRAADRGRRARQHDLPGRARVLGAAPPPEDDRGGAQPGGLPGAAQGDDRRGPQGHEGHPTTTTSGPSSSCWTRRGATTSWR